MDRSFLLGLARDWGIALVAAILLMAGFVYFFGSSPVTGSARPLRAQTLDGEPFDLADLQDKPVILNFWATWCGPCRTEIPEISAFADATPDIHVVGVSVDEGIALSRLRQFAERNRMTYTVVHDTDGTVGRTWEVSTLPTTYAISADGHIVAHRVGTVDRNSLGRMAVQAREHHH